MGGPLCLRPREEEGKGGPGPQPALLSPPEEPRVLYIYGLRRTVRAVFGLACLSSPLTDGVYGSL